MIGFVFIFYILTLEFYLTKFAFWDWVLNSLINNLGAFSVIVSWCLRVLSAWLSLINLFFALFALPYQLFRHTLGMILATINICKWSLDFLIASATFKAFFMENHGLIIISFILFPRQNKLLTYLALHRRMINTLFIRNRVVIQIAQLITVLTFHQILKQERIDLIIPYLIFFVLYK